MNRPSTIVFIVVAFVLPGILKAVDVALVSQVRVPIARLVGSTFHEATEFKEHKSQFGSQFTGQFLSVKNNSQYRLKLAFGGKLGYLTTQPFEIPQPQGNQYVRIGVSVVKGRVLVKVGLLELPKESVELLGKGTVRFTTQVSNPVGETEHTVIGCSPEELGAPRDWNDAQGRTVRAGYMHQDEKDVYIKVQGQKNPSKVAKSTLSPADLEFLKTMLACEDITKK